MNDIVSDLVRTIAIAVLAPAVNGAIKGAKCAFQRRRGPSVFQGYRDVRKLWFKKPTVSDLATGIFTSAPAVAIGCALAAAALMPGFGTGDYAARAIVFIGCLALSRFASVLASADTAGSFGGMGGSRDLFIGGMSEPALAVSLLGLSGSPAYHSVGTVLSAIALGIITVVESGRIPVDNPDTHLELTMVHEGMALEYSGPHLALMNLAAQIRQLVFVVLLVSVVRDDVVGIAIGVPVVAFGLALCECSYAKMRLFRIPGLLFAAWIIAVLGVISSSLLFGS